MSATRHPGRFRVAGRDGALVADQLPGVRAIVRPAPGVIHLLVEEDA
jgi:hypothetical protein